MNPWAAAFYIAGSLCFLIGTLISVMVSRG